MPNKPGFKREITLLQIVIIGIVGAIGTGVLFSAAGMAGDAGPGSLLAWVIGAIMYASVGYTYMELSSTYPEAGGPTRYSLYTHGRFTNLINSFADLVWYLFIPPIEALAVVEGFSYFFPSLMAASGAPTIMGSLLGVLLLLLFVPFNYFGTKVFGQSTAILGIVKLLFYLAVAFGLILIFFRPSNFVAYHGFIPFGMYGVFLAIPLAMFAFGGIRVIPDYAEEVKDKKILPKAIMLTVIGQTIIYILFSIAFIGGIKWSNLNLAVGDWAGLGKLVGNPFIIFASGFSSHPLLVLTLIVGLLGPFVTGYIYLGGGSRILFAMGRSGIVNKSLKSLHEVHNIPYLSLIVFAVIGAFVAFIAAPLPNIYSLITDAVVGGYIGFATNPVAMIVSRMQGVTKNRMKFGNIIAPMAFASASLIVFWSGWPSVPYAVLMMTGAVILFSYLFKIKENISNSVWYILYIAFLLAMTAIGSVGELNVIPFGISTLLVLVGSVVVFYPLGIRSGLAKPFSAKGITTLT
ncbi:MAG: APC family permease [Candidatus Marsarchaeota archaeon]|nr:APC family permease [Candidatus Marsarchaeota archaeon]